MFDERTDLPDGTEVELQLARDERHRASSNIAASTAVIVLTAHDDRNLRDKAMRLGAFAFLTKPFRASERVETIKAALGSTRLSRLLPM